MICSVGIVALYADDIRVSRLRRHGLEAPVDRDLGAKVAKGLGLEVSTEPSVVR